MTYLPVELEKCLKPESTLKDILKLYRNNIETVGFKKNLAFMFDKFNRAEYGEIYSSNFTHLKYSLNQN